MSARGPGSTSGGPREGPAAGAGGAFLPVTQSCLVLSFRSAGHVLYTAPQPARLHLCVTIDNRSHSSWPSPLLVSSFVQVNKSEAPALRSLNFLVEPGLRTFLDLASLDVT